MEEDSLQGAGGVTHPPPLKLEEKLGGLKTPQLEEEEKVVLMGYPLPCLVPTTTSEV